MSRALAVLRLITSSNLVGCCTGRSCGFRAFQDAIDVIGRAQEQVGIVDAIGHQTAGRGERTREIDGGQAVFGRGSEDRVAMHDGEDVGQDQQSAALLACKL